MKISVFTIGGGFAMLPAMQHSLAEAGLMTLDETRDMIALSQMMPGNFGVNAAAFAGMRTAGIPGAVAATCGVITPSLVLSFAAAVWLKQSKTLMRVMATLQPVVLGLIAFSCLSFAQGVVISSKTSAPDWFSLGLFGVGILVLLRFRFPPIGWIAVCAAIGVAQTLISGF